MCRIEQPKVAPRVTGEKSMIFPSVTAHGGYSKGSYSYGCLEMSKLRKRNYCAL